MRTFVYIDGFNFYYGCVKGTTEKWLKLAELCRKLLPPNDILTIKCFTARVEARASDPGQPKPTHKRPTSEPSGLSRKSRSSTADS